LPITSATRLSAKAGNDKSTTIKNVNQHTSRRRMRNTLNPRFAGPHGIGLRRIAYH
jgi:hypothetical protein